MGVNTLGCGENADSEISQGSLKLTRKEENNQETSRWVTKRFENFRRND